MACIAQHHKLKPQRSCGPGYDSGFKVESEGWPFGVLLLACSILRSPRYLLHNDHRKGRRDGGREAKIGRSYGSLRLRLFVSALNSVLLILHL